MATATKTRPRTLRIEDSLWNPFHEKAKSFGLSDTAYLRIVLQKVNDEPVIPISVVSTFSTSPSSQDMQKLQPLRPSSEYLSMIQGSPSYFFEDNDKEVYSMNDGVAFSS